MSETKATMRYTVTGDHGIAPDDSSDAWRVATWDVDGATPSFPRCANRECVDSRWTWAADGPTVRPEELVRIASEAADGTASGALVCWGWQDAERKRSNASHCLCHLHYEVTVTS